jgi:hypothetical protein
MKRSLVGEHTRQHGVIAPRPGLEVGELHRALAASFDLDKMSGHQPMRTSLGESAPRLQSRVVLRGLAKQTGSTGRDTRRPPRITRIGRRQLTRSGPTLAKTRKSPRPSDRGPQPGRQA